METVFNTTISAFGWSIFHSLWQGAIIYGFLFLVMSLPSLSARLKHNLAFGALCLMFCCFLLTFVSVLKTPSASLNLNLSQQVHADNAVMSVADPSGLMPMAERYFPYLVALYTAGVLIQVVMLLYGYRKLGKLKNDQHTAVPPQWSQRFELVLATLKIKRPVLFKLSSKVNVPLVIGFFKPLILFPVSMATQLDLQQVEAILIHELSHIRRNDFLLNLIKAAVETVLFFNPFIWLCSRFIQMEREHDCDDRVVSFTGAPLTYAHALLKIEILKSKDTPTLSLAAAGDSQHLYHRIKRITDMKTTYMSAQQRIFAVTLTLGTIISLAWVSPKKDQEMVRTAAKDVVKHFADLSIITSSPTIDEHAVSTPIYLPIDTPKKKKPVKITTFDAQGRKKEYNAVSDLPDSLRFSAQSDVLQFSSDKFQIDSVSLLALKDNAEAIAKHFDNPEERAKWEKLGLEMQKKGALFAKRFNTPEERAKWQKLGLEMQRQGEAFAKKFNSPEALERRTQLTEGMKKYAEGIRIELNSSEHNEGIKKLNEEMQINTKEFQKMVINPEIQKQLRSLTFNFRTDADIQESIALRDSKEYKKLKQEFEEKVEKLKKKQEK